MSGEAPEQSVDAADAAVEVETDCDGCGRGLPTFLRSQEETLSVTISPVPDDPGEASADAAPVTDASPVTRLTLCGDCADEVQELTDTMQPAGEPERPTSHRTLRRAGACGLCTDSLDDPHRALTLRWRGSRHGSETRFPLCRGCVPIVRTFLSGLPEGVREGSLYYGSGAAPEADEAEREAAAVEAFESLHVGDQIRVVSRVEATTADPPRRHEIRGLVRSRTSALGIAHAVLDADGGSYRLTRPAPTVDRVTLQAARDGGVADLGTVTTILIESPAPPQPVEDDSDRIDLDVESALLPDSLSLDSSSAD